MIYEIAHPNLMKSGEMRVIDPDGAVIFVSQLAKRIGVTGHQLNYF